MEGGGREGGEEGVEGRKETREQRADGGEGVDKKTDRSGKGHGVRQRRLSPTPSISS